MATWVLLGQKAVAAAWRESVPGGARRWRLQGCIAALHDDVVPWALCALEHDFGSKKNIFCSLGLSESGEFVF